MRAPHLFSLMNAALYWSARALVTLLQALPLRWVARLGRGGGALAYVLDARHRRMAMQNLTRIFGAEKSPAEIRALARENFRRLGENYLCALKTAAMRPADLAPHLEFVGTEKFVPPPGMPPQSRIIAIGHFGNFELYARFGQFAPAFQCATTYRALNQPALNRLLQSLRQRSGCLYFERRTEGQALKARLTDSRLLLGLLADQRSGTGGVWLPFLGQICLTSTAPATLALRYRCPLHTAICYRVALARWRIEVSDPIPTHVEGRPRDSAGIMRDVNRAFEIAVRRDPANWFWVHDRWRPSKSGKHEAALAAFQETASP